MPRLHSCAPSILAEVARALKPDGVLALTTPNVVSLFRRLLLDWHPVKLLKVLRGSCRLGSAIEAARLAERGLGLKLVG